MNARTSLLSGTPFASRAFAPSGVPAGRRRGRVRETLCLSGPALAVVVLTIGCGAAPHTYVGVRRTPVDPRCQLEGQRTVLRSEPDAFDAIFDLRPSSISERAVLPTVGSLHRFRARVLGRWGRGFRAPLHPAAHARRDSIREISCLEAALLAIQTDREDMLDRPTELSAFILGREGSGSTRLRVYYSTRDRPGGRLDSTVTDRVRRDVRDGWIALAHLHNHNFFLDDDTIASPSPSAADVALAISLRDSIGLCAMWITNGFETIHIPADAFEAFVE